MQTNELHQALLHHIASSNDLQALLVNINEQPAITTQQHLLILTARVALYDCSNSVRAVAQAVQS